MGFTNQDLLIVQLEAPHTHCKESMFHIFEHKLSHTGQIVGKGHGSPDPSRFSWDRDETNFGKRNGRKVSSYRKS